MKLDKNSSWIGAKIGLTICSGLILSSCVSVNIGAKKAEKSGGVILSEPAAPFVARDGSNADRAWLNRENGNAISYLSTCNDPSDPSLENVQREMLSDIQDQKVIKTEEKTYNSREALQTEVEGYLDGVKTRIEVVVFKKNNCIYSISYVGVAKAFPQDQKTFYSFLESFRAP